MRAAALAFLLAACAGGPTAGDELEGRVPLEASDPAIPTITRLVLAHPPRYPVRIFRRDLSERRALGLTQWNEQARQFWIDLDDDQLENLSLLVDVVIHEWAHVLTWKAGCALEGPHGPIWGVAYAECYQAIYGRRTLIGGPPRGCGRVARPHRARW